MKPSTKIHYLSLFVLMSFLYTCQTGDQTMSKNWLKPNKVINQLKEKFGEEHAPRIEKGVNQVAALWNKDDGNVDDFESFCREQFITNPEKLAVTFDRFEKNLEQISGLNLEMLRTLQEPVQLDMGPMLPVDLLFANYDPFAHVSDDLFKDKIAFTALLNYPLYTLDEILKLSQDWSRENGHRQDWFSGLVPACHLLWNRKYLKHRLPQITISTIIIFICTICSLHQQNIFFPRD